MDETNEGPLPESLVNNQYAQALLGKWLKPGAASTTFGNTLLSGDRPVYEYREDWSPSDYGWIFEDSFGAMQRVDPRFLKELIEQLNTEVDSTPIVHDGRHMIVVGLSEQRAVLDFLRFLQYLYQRGVRFDVSR